MHRPSFLKWETKYNQHYIKHDVIKRGFDVFFSLGILILLFPLYLILSILVFLSSPGPIFYTDIRIGRGYKKIKCFKFRSMVKDADERLKKMMEKDPNIKNEWYTSFKIKNDPRITTIGKFLRKTSLDELPQFINVLTGDLSIVGPRPLTKPQIDLYGSKAEKILSIRPGITGIWQTSGRNSISPKERIQLDELYIDRQSFFLDIKLIIKTIFIIFSPKGAS